MGNKKENNYVSLAGKIIDKPHISHEMEGEKFWDFCLEVKRLSNASDFIPVTVSEKILDVMENKLAVGEYVKVDGEFRSHNKLVDGKSKLMLFTFAKNIDIISEYDLECMENTNNIFLSGTICKQPIYRITPFGKEIADVILAVNRNVSTKSDYIPLIAWGRNAKYLASLSVGTKIEIDGRVQSRDYKKKLSEDETKDLTAYEISVSTLTNLSKRDNVEVLERGVV